MQGFPVPNFGGLNVADDPQEIGWSGAIDLLNVDLDNRGTLRSRDGYSQFTTVAGTTVYDSGIVTGTLTSPVLIVGAGNRLEAINEAGAVTASSTAPTTSPHSFVKFGSATEEAVYIANGVDQIRKWDGAAFSSPAALSAERGRFVAVQQPDNRLVHANGETVAKANRVAFSNAGVPETFAAANYVDIRPNDGEEITALVSWGNLLFAFKRTCFAVFYGNSTSATGGSVFNFRVVEGPGVWVKGSAVAGKDGVYFWSRDGIYRTNGGPPERVSGAITPYWNGDFREGYADYSLSTFESQFYVDNCQPAYAEGRYYFPSPTTSTTKPLYVYDVAGDYWLIWKFAHEINRWLVVLPATATVGSQGLVFGDGTVAKHLYLMPLHPYYDGQQTTDAGTAIAAHYRLGFADLGAQMTEKVLREIVVDGSGSVGVSVAVNDSVTLDTATTLTLGTAPSGGNVPTVANARHRKAYRGRNFSVKLSSVSGGAWVCRRLSAFVRDERSASSSTVSN